MDIPGIYLSEIILVKKDSTNEVITVDPNSKVQPTYNLSVLSEGLVFSLRTMDKNESNSTFIKDLADKLFEVRTTLKTIGYKLFNNGVYQEEYLEVMFSSKEVIREAIKYNAFYVILAHNHPSGNLDPSNDDIDLTKRLVLAGDLLGVKVLDHLIISTNGWYSFLEHGML